MFGRLFKCIRNAFSCFSSSKGQDEDKYQYERKSHVNRHQPSYPSYQPRVPPAVPKSNQHSREPHHLKVHYDVANEKVDTYERVSYVNRLQPSYPSFVPPTCPRPNQPSHKLHHLRVHYDVANEKVNTTHEYSDRVLTFDDKQNIYDVARRPVQQLYNERSKLKKRLKGLPKKTKESKKARADLNEINAKIHAAEQKAAREIFNQTNSAKGMGQDKFDFHGLHVNEAKIIASSFIKPKLGRAEEITIVTGRGQHSADGKSVLREELQKYFIHELKVKCASVPGNQGAFVVSV
jgi:DNA-nicking Smr family endonuclease